MKNKLLILFLLCLVPTAVGKSPTKKDYQYDIEILRKPEIAYAGENNTLLLKITNKGTIPWVVKPENLNWRVRLSYHLMRPDNGSSVIEGIRTDFKKTVNPSESIELKLNYLLPEETGKYSLKIDLLKESYFWFESLSNTPLQVEVNAIDALKDYRDVVQKPGKFINDTNTAVKLAGEDGFLRIGTKHEELKKLVPLILRTFDKNYFKNNSTLEGYFPGSIYPEIWIRDNYYHSVSGRFIFPAARTKNIVEQFLAFYDSRKYVPDFISPDGTAGNYTVATDNPAFLMIMAADYVINTGDTQWLKKKINDTTVYNLLVRLKNSEFKKYFNKKTGTYFSAHNADWGDVEFEDASNDAQYMGENSHKVSGIYTQSLYFYAVNRWSEALKKAKLYQKSMKNHHEADKLRETTNKYLWRDDLGIYKIHFHLGELRHEFSELAIFALGGNVWAIRSGLAENSQAVRILERMNHLQHENNLPTISKVLIPSYPEGFFRNPILKAADSYQNGGFWDWYGGLAVLEEFKYGMYENALQHLNEIAQLINNNKNLYEWYAADGRGKGSPHYLASGSSVFEALMEGYYGIRQEDGFWTINPPLLRESRSIVLKIPGSEILIAYKITPNKRKRTITIEYNLRGQNQFDWEIPVFKADNETVTKFLSRKQNRKNFYYDNIRKAVFYKKSVSAGRGNLTIRY